MVSMATVPSVGATTHDTYAAVCKLLKNLNPGKASGPDEIPICS